MNKNLEELIEFRKDNKLGPRQKIIYHIVCVLEDQEKRLKTVEAELGICTEEEKKNIKNGIGSYCLYA